PLVSVMGISVSMNQGSATVTNNGPFEIYGLSVQTKVLSPSGQVIAYGSSPPVNLQPHSSQIIMVVITPNSSIHVSPLTLNYVTVMVKVNANLMNVLPAIVSFSRNVSLGSAVSGLVVGQPSVVSAGNGFIELKTAVSFVYNMQYVPLSGDLDVTVTNSTGTVGSASVPISATNGQTVNLVVPINLSVSPRALLTEPQTFNISSSIASQGAVYTVGSESYTWNPPLYNLTVSSMQLKPVNSTYSSITVPLSFTDMQNKGFNLGINANLYSGNQQISSTSKSIYAVPGSNTLSVNFLVPNSAPSPTLLVLKFNAFNTSYNQEVSLK
ncbi:MAG: hypothetical protein ACP5NC_08055, partial [Nitrososphaeria archaeon]